MNKNTKPSTLKVVGFLIFTVIYIILMTKAYHINQLERQAIRDVFEIRNIDYNMNNANTSSLIGIYE